ncbi:MAG: DnaA regulatory inactivator Hda [Acidiferrobacterales bacterium]
MRHSPWGGQLALNIRLRDSSSFGNFHDVRNREASLAVAAAVQRAIDASDEALRFEQIFLCGESGCGKTHLLEAAARLAQERGLAPAYVPFQSNPAIEPRILEGLEFSPLVCLDDLQAVAGMRKWEEGALHLYESLRARGGLLLVAASVNPAYLGLGLPDLATRLGAGLVYQLHALTDEDKLAALRLRARNRGLEMGEDAARYMLARYPRDPHALFRLLDRIDQASMAAQRRLTIPFIRSVAEGERQ